MLEEHLEALIIAEWQALSTDAGSFDRSLRSMLGSGSPHLCILHTHASVPRQGLIAGSTMAQSKTVAPRHM